MIKFHKPSEREYELLLKQSIKLYAQDLFECDEFSTLKEAKKMAKQEVMSYIENETNPQNDRIYYIYNNDDHVGYIWYKIEPQYQISVLLYIYIFPRFRKSGFAIEAMRQFENESRRLGALQTHLVVFLGNKKAIPLYQKLGYMGVEEFTLYNAPRDTRRRMVKVLV